MLLQASFLVLALMGLLAVVIDMGIARATQRFMQSSSDVAALEGLRFRDVVPGDPTASDLARRQAASRAAALVFDEDLDLATEAVDYRLGAGPQITTGVQGINEPAGGLLETDGAYLPVLETNAATNEAHGDLVAGTYTRTDPGDPGNPAWHVEDGLYQRLDFAPANAAGAPGATAFLARLRRTNDRLGLDALPGVSSTGPTLPFLFGLGSGVLSTSDPDAYDPRRDGLTVRATSIAEARPAVAAGVMGPLVTGLARVGDDGLDPTVPRVLAFEDELWRNDFVVGGAFEVTVAADATILRVTGSATSTPAGLALRVPTWMRVGSSQSASGSVVLPTGTAGLEGLRYVALYVPASPNVIVTGFAAVDVIAAAPGVDPSGNPVFTIVGTKLASLVAPENASAVPALATDPSALLPPVAAREPLLAPVLAR